MTDTSPARGLARALICGLAVLVAGVNTGVAHAHPRGRAHRRGVAHGRSTQAVVAPVPAAQTAETALESDTLTYTIDQALHADGAQPAVSKAELDCLTAAVYYEARGESLDGQAAVAQVVLNRLHDPAFPKSICGVVFQRASARRGCQFTFVCDGSLRRRKEQNAWMTAELIASRALAGFVMPQVGDATHYHVAGLQTNWGPDLAQVAQIGLHVFYQMTDNARAALGLVPPDHPIAYASMLPTFGLGARAPAASPTPAPQPASAGATAMLAATPAHAAS